jgi:hemolysin III
VVAAPVSPAKPFLRGWSHALAGVAAVVCSAALISRSRDDLARLLSMAVYGLSMTELYAMSAVYHLGPWQGRRRTVLRALDRASIFVLIAGTYTPFCVNVLAGWTRPTMLVLVWSFAAIGVSASVLRPSLPRWVAVALYVGMGWIALLAAPVLVPVLPPPALTLLVGGGLLYTAGAVVYAGRRPDPSPRVFGFHEVFHLLVIAGSAAFLAVIWVWVVPFRRP